MRKNAEANGLVGATCGCAGRSHHHRSVLLHASHVSEGCCWMEFSEKQNSLCSSAFGCHSSRAGMTIPGAMCRTCVRCAGHCSTSHQMCVSKRPFEWHSDESTSKSKPVNSIQALAQLSALIIILHFTESIVGMALTAAAACNAIAIMHANDRNWNLNFLGID